MNEEDVQFAYHFLGHKNQSEIRLLDPPEHIFVHSEEEFVEACRAHDGKRNLYVGVNERRPGGTAAEDVISINAIVLDIDPVRPKGEASTDAELEEALATARGIQANLRERGLMSRLAMSGNGCHVWIKVNIREDLPRAEAGIQAFQRAIIDLVDYPTVRVDNIGDLPRIIKVIGSTSVKGQNTPERPWRVSRWIDDRTIPPINEVFAAKLLDYEPGQVERIAATSAELNEEEVEEILKGLGPRSRGIFEGEWKDHGYVSRSEAEMALATAMAMRGMEPERVSAMLYKSAVGKWQEAGDGYRELTLGKAFDFAQERYAGRGLGPNEFAMSDTQSAEWGPTGIKLITMGPGGTRRWVQVVQGSVRPLMKLDVDGEIMYEYDIEGRRVTAKSNELRKLLEGENMITYQSRAADVLAAVSRGMARERRFVHATYGVYLETSP